MLNKFTSS